MEVGLLGFILLVLLCFYFTTIFWKAGCYFASLANFIFACYEGLGPLALIFPESLTDNRLEFALQSYSEGGFAALPFLGGALLGFVIMVNVVFLGFKLAAINTFMGLGATVTLGYENRSSNYFNPGVFMVFCLTVFVFGVIAVLDDAGTKRLGDYIGYNEYVTPFYSYALAILPASALVIWHAYESRRYSFFILGLISCIPIVFEAFISSRRQFLLPIPATLVLYWLYSGENARVVINRASVFSILLILAFYAQYSTRLLTQGDQEVNVAAIVESFDVSTGVVEVASPIFSELIAVSAITHAVFSSIGGDQVTFGLQWIVTALNSAPYLKVGNWIFPNYLDTLYDTIIIFAPFGAFPVAAELMLSFGTTFFVVGAAFIGAGIYMAEYAMHRLVRNDSPLVYVIFSYCAVMLVKYRSGLSDMIQYSLPHFLLCGTALALGITLGHILPRTKVSAG